MKQLIALVIIIIVFIYDGNSQKTVTPSPAGYDIFRSGIPHGNIDTITYNSKTAGNNRRALICFLQRQIQKSLKNWFLILKNAKKIEIALDIMW